MNFLNKIKSVFKKAQSNYHDFKTKGAGKTMFYGRYRRVELAKKIVIVIAAILVLSLMISFVSKKIIARTEQNVNFEYLKSHFKGLGYSCQEIEKDGGRCFIESDVSSVYFTRYDAGFYYLIKTDSYSIYFRHIANSYNDITFTTTEDALIGYKGNIYTCYTNDGIVGELENCVTRKGIKLDSETYLSVISNSINSLNDIINASGYDRQELLDNYYWKK